MEKLRLGVLGSGKGSNYRAIQEAILRGEFTAGTSLSVDVEDGHLVFRRIEKPDEAIKLAQLTTPDEKK